MRSRLIFIFLTLVWWGARSAVAAPTNDLTDSTATEEVGVESQSESQPNLIDSNNLVVTPVELSAQEKKEISYLYPYQQSISPRVILIADLDQLRAGEGLPYGLGVGYLAPRKRQPQWEAGAELYSTSDGQIYASARWVQFPDNYFRPYTKLGLSHVWRADEKLASFGNWKNYYLRGAVGFEDVIKPPMSVLLELSLAVSTEETQLQFSFGYSWGF
jgi:hypothetical protein